MSVVNLIATEQAAFNATDLLIDCSRRSGFVLQSIDVAAAVAALQSLYADDETEQRETFAYLINALNETRAANGERLLF